jgi:hypothetical protein
MMSQSDFDNLAALANDRHADMLAEAHQQQLLHAAAPTRSHGSDLLRRLQEFVAHLWHAGRLGSPGTGHTNQHHRA